MSQILAVSAIVFILGFFKENAWVVFTILGFLWFLHYIGHDTR
jgi:hypothetical protein